MRRVVATGRSDVGNVRDSNEDALLVRDSVYAVADGMGGHLAGEVASATALEPIEELDGRIFQDNAAAVTALRDAVVAANERVSQLAIENPDYRGMGTTLTAALVEGRRLHVAHVGDSRAYLLRDGYFSQLTDDHTLVQHLVDEGQITREEAARHPQRSVITRAIGVSEDVEVDSMSLELQPGDQVLLCSDGLSGVVEDNDIAGTLLEVEETDDAVDALIELANDAGGPDNITVLLLRYEDPDAEEVPSNRTISISSRVDSGERDWAGEMGRYASLSKGATVLEADKDGDRRSVGAILGKASAIVLAVAVVAGLVFGGSQFLLSRSFFVGLDGDQVVIYEGINRELGPFELYRVAERSEVDLDDVQPWYRPQLEDGFAAADLGDARTLVRNIPLRDTEEEGAPDEGVADDEDGDA
ncbi:MAG: Stp1/IreP family PP2C-type Ser/Thr phosphatase [Nitriliruptoraceae bacterium]